jgi:HAD superfamily hydrolase (TIGR01509 family)
MIRGVIFDLDGVVADSHPLHEEAWRALLSEQGVDPFSLDFIYSGLSRGEILEHYLGPLSEDELEKLGRRKDHLFSRKIHRVQARPSFLRALDQLDAAGVRYALATSAGSGRTYEILRHFGITSRFAAIVTSKDVSYPKPSPEAFLEAASRLVLVPQDVVVVEDSVAGVRAARAAGMISIGYAPAERAKSLWDAGASDVISDFPLDMMSYLQRLAETVPMSPTGD